MALQDTPAVPEPVSVLGLIVEQVSPDGMESDRLTVALNPFRDPMVRVAETVAWAFTIDGVVAVIV